MELLKAGLADPDWLFGIRGEGIPRRTFSAENVPTVSAVMLEPEGREKVSINGLDLLGAILRAALTFLTVTEKPFPQPMQFCTSLSSAHFLVRDCDCLIYSNSKTTTLLLKSSKLAKYVSTFANSLAFFVFLLI